MRWMVAPNVVLALLLPAAAAHGASCEPPRAATQVWRTDDAHAAWRKGDRLVGCQHGYRWSVTTAVGVRGASVGGGYLGLYRERRHRCRVELLELNGSEDPASRVAVRCGRLRRVVTTAQGAIALQQVSGERTRVLEVAAGRRRVVDRRADRRPLSAASLGEVTWWHGGRPRSHVVGRFGCRERRAFSREVDGTLRVWSEPLGARADGVDVLLTCDAAVGRVSILEVSTIGSFPSCGQSQAVLLRRPYVVLEDDERYGRCEDHQVTLRTVDVRTSHRLARLQGAYNDDLERVLLLPDGGLLASFVQPAFGDPAPTAKVVTKPSGGPQRTLADGPGVDAASLTLDGATARWTQDGVATSAQVGD